MKPEVN